jgi:hypothetical protein
VHVTTPVDSTVLRHKVHELWWDSACSAQHILWVHFVANVALYNCHLVHGQCASLVTVVSVYVHASVVCNTIKTLSAQR